MTVLPPKNSVMISVGFVFGNKEESEYSVIGAGVHLGSRQEIATRMMAIFAANDVLVDTKTLSDLLRALAEDLPYSVKIFVDIIAKNFGQSSDRFFSIIGHSTFVRYNLMVNVEESIFYTSTRLDATQVVMYSVAIGEHGPFKDNGIPLIYNLARARGFISLDEHSESKIVLVTLLGAHVTDPVNVMFAGDPRAHKLAKMSQQRTQSGNLVVDFTNATIKDEWLFR